jgi:hypothetical protein
MTVAVTSAYSAAFGDGSNKVFSFTFRCNSAAEVQVYKDEVLQVSGFTTVVNSNGVGGTVTFTAAPANGVKVVVASFPLFTQLTQFENAGSFLPATHDAALDAAALRDVYLNARVDKCLRLPWGETAVALPKAATRANLYLMFDGSGNPTVGNAQGIPGPTGPAGPTGATGATGPTGPAATNPNYTYAINTLSPGASATIAATGTYPNVTLTFGIPKGDAGASGALSNGTYGDIVVTSSGATLTIGGGAVTLPKMANLAANSFIGNNTGSSATPVAMSVAQAKTLLTLVKADVGLGNVDNTSDANKPVSSAQQTALDTKADANNAVLTGNPVAPTPVERDADTSIATMAAVDRLYDVDQVSKSSTYTLTLSDRGRTVATTAGVHVPPNSSVAFPIGAFVELYNNSNSSITVDFSSGTDVFRKVGVTTTVTTLTLAARSLGQLRKPSSTTEWLAIGFS